MDTISSLLQDPIPKVRQAAAYALGQLQVPEAEAALIQSFQNQDSLGANSEVNAAILEAIGKCGTAETLGLLSQVTTYQKSDNWLLLGQARAIYRFMQRGIIHPAATQRMINLLADAENAQEVRILAANYLARADLELVDHTELISLIYGNEQDLAIQVFLPQVLAKADWAAHRNLFESTLSDVIDYRVRCNTLRAIGKADYPLFKRNIHRDLYDQNRQVAKVASQVILDHGSSRYWREYMNLSLDDFPWQVKINLLRAVNKFIPPGNGMFRDINDQKLQQRIRSANNEYEQAAAILALAEHPRWYKYIIDFEARTSAPVLKSTAILGLVRILNHATFARQRNDLQQAVVDRLVGALNSGDVGVVSIAAAALDLGAEELSTIFLFTDWTKINAMRANKPSCW